MPDPRLSTGLPSLDEVLDGGLPPGSLVAITTPPAAPIELLLTALATSADLGQVAYLPTARSPAVIQRQFRHQSGSDTPRAPDHIQFIDGADPAHALIETIDPDAPAPVPADPAPPTTAGRPAQEAPGDADATAASSTDRSTTASDGAGAPAATTAPPSTDEAGSRDPERPGAWIVDTFTDVLQAPGANADALWRDGLDALRDWVDAGEAAGLAVLVLTIPAGRAATRPEAAVLERADAVFEYHRGDHPGDDTLVIPKLRGGRVPERAIALDLGGADEGMGEERGGSSGLSVNPDRRV